MKQTRREAQQLMISVSGVRGVVGATLTPTVLAEFAASFATYCRAGKIVLARDTRPSGEMARHAILSGLLAGGCRVLDIGVVPTPTAQLEVEHQQAAGGIVITASHNPAEWNAMKFIGPDGLFLGPGEGARLLRIHGEKRWKLRGHESLGSLEHDAGAADRHIERILALPEVAVTALRARRLHVALDCVNGAGAVLVPRLLAALGCTVSAIFCEPTGRFGRGTEPVPENLAPLCALVKTSGASIGLALDPDSDRLALVDEDGQPLGEEATLTLALIRLLSVRRGPVVVNLSTSMANEAVAARYDCRLFRSAVGEANVARAMRKVRAVGGGEGNGGVIHPGLHLGRDAPVAAALVLSLLAEGDPDGARTPRAILGKLPPAFMVKSKIGLPRKRLERLGTTLARRYSDARLDRRDGYRLTWSDRWLHVRGSGTEPIVRIIAEARDARTAGALADEAAALARRLARA